MKRRGFTLVELLIVIAVIAILAAILFPVFASARERARSHTCEANLGQLSLALHVYARDYDGRFPPDHNDLRPLVVPYVNGIGIFRCPSDSASPPTSLPRGPSNDTTNRVQPVNTGLIPFPPPPLLCSYQYRGGLTVDDRGDVPILADWSFQHHGAANVASVSGAVHSVTSGRWTPVAPGPRPGSPSGQMAATPFLPIPWRLPSDWAAVPGIGNSPGPGFGATSVGGSNGP